MVGLSRIFLVSPSHQLARIKYFAGRVRNKICGAPDRFRHISMTKVDDVHRGTTDDGFVWHVVSQDKSLVSWARTLIEKHVRFEDHNLIESGDVVVNVGACSGEYTKYAAGRVGPDGTVYAFEPDPNYYVCLVANMNYYTLPWVKCIQAGASDKDQTLTLYRIEGAMAGGSVDEDYREKHSDRITSSLEVPFHRLDTYFSGTLGNIRALVVTVNGHELEVLQGAEKLLNRTDFVIYQSEAHWQIKEYLDGCGFKEVEANYAGPEGGTDQHIALFGRIARDQNSN